MPKKNLWNRLDWLRQCLLVLPGWYQLSNLLWTMLMRRRSMVLLLRRAFLHTPPLLRPSRQLKSNRLLSSNDSYTPFFTLPNCTIPTSSCHVNSFLPQKKERLPQSGAVPFFVHMLLSSIIYPGNQLFHLLQIHRPRIGGGTAVRQGDFRQFGQIFTEIFLFNACLF